MTTFHDPPPQSRRAARQSEREHTSDGQPTVEGFTTFPAQNEGQQPSELHEEAPLAPAIPDAKNVERAAHEKVFSGPDSEPAPHERTLTRRELRELRAREEAANPSDAPADAPADAAQPERVAPVVPVAPVQPSISATPKSATIPAAAAPAVVSPARPSLADLAAAASAAAHTPSAPAKSVDELSFAPDSPVYVEPPALIDPLAVAPEAAAADAPQDALSAFESLLASSDGSPASPTQSESPRSPLAGLPAPTAAPAPLAAPSIAKTTESSTASELSAAPAGPGHYAPETIEGLLGLAPAPVAATVEPASTAPGAPSQTTLSDARAEFDELSRKRLDGDVVAPAMKPVGDSTTPQRDTTAAASSLSAGHWSKQATIDDDSSDAIVARTIGSGSTATNALVLPAIPFAKDIRGPLNSSGETMLTGSIDLPSTLSASGVSDRFDKGDIDSLLDLNDSDMVSTDSAPVRAVRAVSTFSNQSVTQTQKPKGTRALTVLLISAASMAVVVAGLLVAAFAFNML